MNNKDIQTLTVGSLFNDNYIIPIYQRNYAWGKAEIEQLITDILDAQNRNSKNNYYIGSLVVSQRDNGDYEVIDGQQRLTTLSIMLSALDDEFINNQLKFEYRKHSTNSLNNLWKNTEATNAIEEGYHIVKNYPQSNKLLDNKDVKNFLLNNVIIIRTKVPPETDLNHYFEIMNNRGEQLEKHEIIKSRLMSKLHKEDSSSSSSSSVFAMIWDSCSDMSRYAVMGFKKEIRNELFFEESGDKKLMDLWKVIHDKHPLISKTDDYTPLKIIDCIGEKKEGGDESNTNDSERFNSIINFSNFLIYALRIYLEEVEQNTFKTIPLDDKNTFKTIPLDDKNILKYFDGLVKGDTDSIKKFSITLLKTRLLFDNFVIKTDRNNKDAQWSLKKPKLDKDNSIYYTDSHSSDEKKTTIMLLSMFHVSYPQRSYKNWLYAVLRGLVLKNWAKSSKNYIEKLEQLSDKFYFGVYCNNQDFLSVIFGGEYKCNTNAENHFLDQGTAVPTFVFNRLDYLLWKNWQEISKKVSSEGYKINIYKNTYFSYQNSVEHYYPQNPLEGIVKLETDILLNSFGNLCLVTQSRNAKLNNDTTGAKRDYYEKKGDYDSLKQQLMMSYEKWGKAQIEDHEGSMKKLLNNQSPYES